MVLRVTALRGSVPQLWATDFATAMEGYGVVAISQRTRLADVWKDLAGGGGDGGKRGAPAAPTTVDAVTLGDAWLQPAIAQGLIQPIVDVEQYRWWVSVSLRGGGGQPRQPLAA